MTAMSNSGPTLNRSVPGCMYPGDHKSERDPEFRTRPEIRFLKKFLYESNDREKDLCKCIQGNFHLMHIPMQSDGNRGIPNTLGILILFNPP